MNPKWITPTIRPIPTKGLIPLWADRLHPGLLLRSVVQDAAESEANVDMLLSMLETMVQVREQSELAEVFVISPAVNPETCLDYCGRESCRKL